MSRTGRGRRLGTRTDRATSWIHNFNLCSFYGLNPSEKSPRLVCVDQRPAWHRLWPAKSAYNSSRPVLWRIRGGEDLREAASWPCKPSGLRICTKENESETRVGGKQRGWGRWRGRPGGARPRRAWRRPRRVGQCQSGGGGERPAGPAMAGRPRPTGLAKDVNAPHHAQEATAQPRPGSHSSRLPFPLSPVPRGPAPGRRDPYSLLPLGFLKPAPAPGAPAHLDVREGGTLYLSSPGLNRSPSPPSPPRSAITDSPSPGGNGRYGINSLLPTEPHTDLP